MIRKWANTTLLLTVTIALVLTGRKPEPKQAPIVSTRSGNLGAALERKLSSALPGLILEAQSALSEVEWTEETAQLPSSHGGMLSGSQGITITTSSDHFAPLTNLMISALGPSQPSEETGQARHANVGWTLDEAGTGLWIIDLHSHCSVFINIPGDFRRNQTAGSDASLAQNDQKP